MSEDFINTYLSSYAAETECPLFFSRWAAISGIGAFLGRQFYFNHGHFEVYPNLYCMLIGSPGTRKSTAIKLMKKIMLSSGYEKIAADKTTKEKFLLDLAGEGDLGTENGLDILEQNLFGESQENSDAEIYVMADEFNDFFGNGNIEFISLLGNLWDYSGIYRNRIKTGKSVAINNPTVSILGGNTPTGFAMAFPTEILGQGFFSRILLVYGEPNGRRITFPKAPDIGVIKSLVSQLQRIKQLVFGPANLERTAELLLERIYKYQLPINDVRFESYSNRRFSHLLKLVLIVSASRESKTITESDVIWANTLLSFTEQLMPKALGEFGKSKNSDVSHKIIQLAESAKGVLTFKEIWENLHSDLEKMQDLTILIQNLVQADKLQIVPGGQGFLPKKKQIIEHDKTTVDWTLLTPEERNGAI